MATAGHQWVVGALSLLVVLASLLSMPVAPGASASAPQVADVQGPDWVADHGSVVQGEQILFTSTSDSTGIHYYDSNKSEYQNYSINGSDTYAETDGDFVYFGGRSDQADTGDKIYKRYKSNGTFDVETTGNNYHEYRINGSEIIAGRNDGKIDILYKSNLSVKSTITVQDDGKPVWSVAASKDAWFASTKDVGGPRFTLRINKSNESVTHNVTISSEDTNALRYANGWLWASEKNDDHIFKLHEANLSTKAQNQGFTGNSDSGGEWIRYDPDSDQVYLGLSNSVSAFDTSLSHQWRYNAPNNGNFRQMDVHPSTDNELVAISWAAATTKDISVLYSNGTAKTEFAHGKGEGRGIAYGSKVLSHPSSSSGTSQTFEAVDETRDESWPAEALTFSLWRWDPAGERWEHLGSKEASWESKATFHGLDDERTFRLQIINSETHETWQTSGFEVGLRDTYTYLIGPRYCRDDDAPVSCPNATATATATETGTIEEPDGPTIWTTDYSDPGTDNGTVLEYYDPNGSTTNLTYTLECDDGSTYNVSESFDDNTSYYRTSVSGSLCDATGLSYSIGTNGTAFNGSLGIGQGENLLTGDAFSLSGGGAPMGGGSGGGPPPLAIWAGVGAIAAGYYLRKPERRRAAVESVSRAVGRG